METSTPGTAPAPGRRASRVAFDTADVAGTAVFAVGGAGIGMAAGLDLLGIVVVGFCTALVGGVLRDLLLGDAPPAAFRSPLRLAVATAGALLAIPLRPVLDAEASVIVVLDAIALALFAVAGTEKALAFRMNAFVAIALGTITAVGGGVVRDVLVGRPPVVLTEGFYASAALLGSAAVVLAIRVRLDVRWAMAIGFAVCLAARLAAIAFGWSLPTFG
ncbi:trimeric intracellular cation channel family protein [Agromyces sp. LHK192]|uniref:trimeric intracellular cation channel family protein n=1 Tax=Agromyces sp. LHK192 TaxID=2498704 RepID=UPI00196AED38|nr:TRIC cation channel family protein [Agromyces sp. LHK192]